MRGFF
ncbi:hypothetical protein CP8484711_0307A, partial [Chlamydia psittaci 84-8471/1]|jgi:hypothetical protein